MNLILSSNDKNKENQKLSLSTLFSAFALLIVIVVLFQLILGGSGDENRQRALGKAQSLAYQIAVLDLKKTAEAQKSGREPASLGGVESTGTMGVDPWGQAYHYKIQHEGRRKVIEVWSAGENGIRTQVQIPQDSQ